MKMWSLVLSLPTENAAARQRTWRALKAIGAAVLRDGVYLMPDREDCRDTLNRIAQDVRDGGGRAQVVRMEPSERMDLELLFGREQEYSQLLAAILQARARLTARTAARMTAQARKLRKALSALAGIDYFPGESQARTRLALEELESACAQAASPDEPHASSRPVHAVKTASFQRRTWATRRRPWVDRLASAWLIRRFIDPKARLLWLDTPAQCPKDAVGFDFDGATFTHAEGRVTFEVLLASFGLDKPSLARLGAVVHFLDVGGEAPADAAGIESVLAGMRATIADDDRLLMAAEPVFDALLAAYERESTDARRRRRPPKPSMP